MAKQGESDDGYIIRLQPEKRGWLAALFRVVGQGETKPIKSARGESPDQALRELGASGTIEVKEKKEKK